MADGPLHLLALLVSDSLTLLLISKGGLGLGHLNKRAVLALWLETQFEEI